MSDNLKAEASSEELGTSEETGESGSEDTNEGAAGDAGTSSQDNGAQGASEGDEWLIPGRFKKGDEAKLVESYRHLETYVARKENEFRNLQRGNQPAQQQEDPDKQVEAFAKDLKENPIKAIRKYAGVDAVMEDIKAREFQNAYNYAMQTNKEFAELEPVMTQIAQENQDLLKGVEKHDTRILKILFLAAKGAKQAEQVLQAEASGKRKGEASATKKMRVQVEGASGSRGNVRKNIDDMSYEEMKKAIERGDLT